MCIDLPNGKQATKINYISINRVDQEGGNAQEEPGASTTDCANMETLQE